MDAEASLDADISITSTLIATATSREERLRHLDHMLWLIRQRSPEHVARLEREKLERARRDYGKRVVF